MPCLVAWPVLLPLLMSLAKLAFTLPADETVPSACGYIKNSTLLVLSCSQPHTIEIPARLMLKRGVRLSPIGTTLDIENATHLTVEPPPLHSTPVELKRCGLSGLRLLPELAEGLQLLLNLSGLGLRLSGQSDFDGIGGPVRVVSLDLSHNLITLVPSGTFNALSGLAALDLSENLISYLDNDTFCQLTSLRWLNIIDNPMKMTFALVHLPALESLDTSMLILEVGVFCRMSRLRRIILHQPLLTLQCFVFDSLPQLRELSFSYFPGSICFTMMCDPHPVLNQRVPFNFTITKLFSNGSIEKVATNFFLQKNMLKSRSLYYMVCKKTYQSYLEHHENDMPVTTGCLTLESQSPVCPSQVLSPFDSACLRTNSTTVTSLASSVTNIVTDTAFSTTAAVVNTDEDSLGIKADVGTVPVFSSIATSFAPAARKTAATDNSVASTTAAASALTRIVSSIATTEGQRTALAADSDTASHPVARRPPIAHHLSRVAELEAVILRQERVLIAMYTTNGVLILCLTLLLVRCLLSRYCPSGGQWQRRPCVASWDKQQEQPLTPLQAPTLSVEVPLVDAEELLAQ